MTTLLSVLGALSLLTLYTALIVVGAYFALRRFAAAPPHDDPTAERERQAAALEQKLERRARERVDARVVELLERIEAHVAVQPLRAEFVLPDEQKPAPPRHHPPTGPMSAFSPSAPPPVAEDGRTPVPRPLRDLTGWNHAKTQPSPPPLPTASTRTSRP